MGGEVAKRCGRSMVRMPVGGWMCVHCTVGRRRGVCGACACFFMGRDEAIVSCGMVGSHVGRIFCFGSILSSSMLNPCFDADRALLIPLPTSSPCSSQRGLNKLPLLGLRGLLTLDASSSSHLALDAFAGVGFGAGSSSLASSFSPSSGAPFALSLPTRDASTAELDTYELDTYELASSVYRNISRWGAPLFPAGTYT